jgi:flagellar motor switch protein FliG
VSDELGVGEAPGALMPQAFEEPPVSGRRKAAVLLAALGPDLAASVIQHLQDEEIEGLSLEMTQLDDVEAHTAESVLTELAAATSGQQGVSGGVELARAVLERALGSERADELLGRVAGATARHPFEFLRRTPPDQIAGFLRGESPQTAALVIANLNSGLAAQVLARLPESTRPEVALRIARLGKTSPAVLQEVEELVRRGLTAGKQREYASGGGTQALADILGRSDRSTERAVLEHLGSSDGELAEAVRSKLFVFEDLVKLEDRAIQQVLREADQKDLVLALRTASDEIKESLLSNMSERGAEMLKEELEIQQPQRRSDVDAAQGRIVAVVRRLEEAGSIVIAGGEDEEEAVV